MPGIPRVRDDKLYSTVLEVLRLAPKEMLFTEVRDHRAVKPLIKNQRVTRINEVLVCLGKKHQIQLGYGHNGLRVAASIDKPFPGSKEPPVMKDGRKKWARRGPNAGKLPDIDPAAAATPPESTVSVHVMPLTEPEPAPPLNQAPYIEPNISLDTLARQFAAQIASQLCERIVEAINLQLPNQINALVETYKANGGKPAKAERPKVIVAGLLPQQAGLMVQEFGQQLDFSFIESQEASNSKRIDALVASHDVAFAMTGFMSHSLYDKLRGAKTFRHVSGGLSSLREQLRAYIQSQGATKH